MYHHPNVLQSVTLFLRDYFSMNLAQKLFIKSEQAAASVFLFFLVHVKTCCPQYCWASCGYCCCCESQSLFVGIYFEQVTLSYRRIKIDGNPKLSAISCKSTAASGSNHYHLVNCLFKSKTEQEMMLMLIIDRVCAHIHTISIDIF